MNNKIVLRNRFVQNFNTSGQGKLSFQNWIEMWAKLENSDQVFTSNFLARFHTSPLLPFKISIFCLSYVLIRIKAWFYDENNKSIHSCQFIHHGKFCWTLTTVNNLFKNDFERGKKIGKSPCFIGMIKGSQKLSDLP